MKTKREKQSELRAAVGVRDKGMCQICGLDTEWLKRELWPVIPAAQFDFVSYTYKTDEDALGIVQAYRQSMAQYSTQLREFALAIQTRGNYLLLHPWARKLRKWDQWWEADHIIPLAEGGKNTLENMRCLCLKCHKQATKELAGRRARNPKKSYNTFAR